MVFVELEWLVEGNGVWGRGIVGWISWLLWRRIPEDKVNFKVEMSFVGVLKKKRVAIFGG